MSSRFNIDNTGIGGTPFLTFKVDPIAGQSFTAEDIEAGTTACAVTDHYVVGKGEAGDKLLGKVVWVSQEFVPGTAVPALCAVQARGVARFLYSNPAPAVGQMVELDGTGKVRRASASPDLPAGGHLARGQVIGVDPNAGTCDVWLG